MVLDCIYVLYTPTMYILLYSPLITLRAQVLSLRTRTYRLESTLNKIPVCLLPFPFSTSLTSILRTQLVTSTLTLLSVRYRSHHQNTSSTVSHRTGTSI